MRTLHDRFTGLATQLTWVVLLWGSCAGLAFGRSSTQPAGTRPASGPAEPVLSSQPAASGPAADTAALSVRLIAVPANDEEIAARLVSIRESLAKLGAPTSQPSTAPATSPADELAVARWRLAEIANQYITELELWQKARAETARLQSDEAVSQLKADIDAWTALQQERSRHGREDVSLIGLKNDLEAVSKERADWAAELEAYQTNQSARMRQINVLQGRKTDAEEAQNRVLADLKQYVSELPPKLAQAGNEDGRNLLLMDKRILEWQHGLQALRSAAIPDMSSQLEIARQQDEDRVKVLGKLLTTLRARQSELEKALTQDDITIARAQSQREDIPDYLRTYWRIRLAVAQCVADFQKYRQFFDENNARFSQADFDQLASRAAYGRGELDKFMKSLDRRSGDILLIAYRRIVEATTEYEERRTEFQKAMNLVDLRLRAATDRHDRMRVSVNKERRLLDAQIKAIEGNDITRARELQAKFTAEYGAMGPDRIEKVVQDLENLRDRLDKAVVLVSESLDLLERARSRMYWRRIVVSEPGLLEMEWSQVVAQWDELKARQGDTYARIEAGLDRVRTDFRELKARQWLLAVLMVVVGIYLGLGARNRLQAWLDAKEQRIRKAEEAMAADKTPEGTSINSVLRLDTQFIRAFGQTAPVLWPLLFLWIDVNGISIGGQAFPVVGALLRAAMMAVIGFAAINAAFDSRRPDHRIVRCSDAAARYHRRWLRGIGVCVLVLLTIPLFAREAGLVPAIARVVWDINLSIVLVLMFLYFVRRRMFVHLAGDRRAAGLLARMWPKVFTLVPIAIVAMMVLQLAGYIALVDYVLRSLALTLAILAAAKVVRGLLAAWAGTIQEFVVTHYGRIPSEAEPAAPNPLWRMAAQVGRLVVVVLAGVLILGVWGVSWVDIRRFANLPLLSFDHGAVTIARVLWAATAVVVGVIVSRTVRAFLQAEVFSQSQHLDRGTQAAISTLLHYSVIGLAIYIGLKLLLLDFGALTILFGTLGLGLGLGLQPLFVNFVSGLILLLERQIKVGDTIQLPDGTPCEVLGVTMRSTKIRTPDNIEHVIPNGDFINSPVISWTLTDTRLRARMQIGVAYGTDPQLVRKLLLDIAHRHPDVLVEPAPEVWFVEFGENSLNFILAVWFANAAARWRFLSQVRFEMTDLFKQHGIEIPFPQRTISFLGDKPVPVEVLPPKPASQSEPEPPVPGSE